jgi:hypothetical protein
MLAQVISLCIQEQVVTSDFVVRYTLLFFEIPSASGVLLTPRVLQGLAFLIALPVPPN